VLIHIIVVIAAAVVVMILIGYALSIYMDA
jgi:hypothetical protein